MAEFLGSLGSLRRAAPRLGLAPAAAVAMLGPALEPAWAIVGGEAGGPRPDAVLMVLNNRGGVCSGVVLAPTIVLTAAHCVPRGSQPVAHFRDQGAPVLIESATVALHPGYRANAERARARSIDLALLRLTRALPARFAAATLSPAVPAERATVTVAGFGQSREGDASSTGNYRSASLRVTNPYGPSRLLLWAGGRPGHGACTGDSGGPAFDGADRVVAITSWSVGNGRSRCGQQTQAVLLGEQRGWIDQVVGGWQGQAAWSAGP